MTSGTVTAHGTPRELYDRPPTPQVAAAIGIANILDGEIVGDRVRCAFGELPAPSAQQDRLQDRPRPCQVLLRPESLHLRTTPDEGASPATVRQVRYHGHDTLVDLAVDADGLALTARITGRAAPQPGQRVWIATTEAPHVWS